MPILNLGIGIAFLFSLIILLKLNGFLALFLTALLVGTLQGMPLLGTPEQRGVILSIEKGVGDTMGQLGVIVALGAILGKVLSETGAAQRLAITLVDRIGKRRVAWAIAAASFIIGITLFWQVSFMILIPIVYTVAIAAGLPLLTVGVPTLAAITVTHCFLPPHPGPVAVIGIFSANLGLVLVLGILVGIPAMVVAGPFWAWVLRREEVAIPHHLVTQKTFAEEELPSFASALVAALLPVGLIVLDLIGTYALPDGRARDVLRGVGNADVAMLIGVFAAMFLLGWSRRRTTEELMTMATSALAAIGPIMFVIGGGGAFKQVILDSGMATSIGDAMVGWPIHPLLLAYLIASLVRIVVGSATVTVFTSSALVLPLIAGSAYPPELFVLAVTAGSVVAGPPNDAAFWMTKEFFNLSMRQNVLVHCGTLTIISVVAIAGVMLLSLVMEAPTPSTPARRGDPAATIGRSGSRIFLEQARFRG
jgi:gluconate transporter